MPPAPSCAVCSWTSAACTTELMCCATIACSCCACLKQRVRWGQPLHTSLLCFCWASSPCSLLTGTVGSGPAAQPAKRGTQNRSARSWSAEVLRVSSGRAHMGNEILQEVILYLQQFYISRLQHRHTQQHLWLSDAQVKCDCRANKTHTSCCSLKVCSSTGSSSTASCC